MPGAGFETANFLKGIPMFNLKEITDAIELGKAAAAVLAELENSPNVAQVLADFNALKDDFVGAPTQAPPA